VSNSTELADPTKSTDPTGRTVAISTLRRSHDRLTALLQGLDADGIRQESYDAGWPIAQVASHLGSQAEVFGLVLEAGLTGNDVPDMPAVHQIWARWDSSTPEEQVKASLEANEAFLAGVENLSPEDQERFTAEMFGTEVDLKQLVAMKLSEHAIHTWDVATALDPAATVSDDAVALLLDDVPALAAQVGTPTTEPTTIAVTVTDPERRYLVVTGPAVSVAAIEDNADDGTDASLRLPAEAFLRLVYGRLDPTHVPAGVIEGAELETLRTVFRGL
jgi:uncharacterized protein (TIGR03083 family)